MLHSAAFGFFSYLRAVDKHILAANDGLEGPLMERINDYYDC